MADAGSDVSALQNRLDALRASGAAERDPVRFAYLAGLARRAATQPEPIRRPLLAKLDALIDQLADHPATLAKADNEPASPLTELLAYIARHAHEPLEATPSSKHARREAAPGENSQPKSTSVSAGRSLQAPELKSVTYFRNEWSKLSTEQQLTQTLAQAPENAGPMNSQHLVLRALQVMRELSPDYLQGFMSYVDTLIWLDHADPTRPPPGRISSATSKARTRAAKRSASSR